MVGRIRRAMLKVLLGAASSVAGTPRVAYAPLSQDTQDMLRSWMGTKLNNPDPLMDQESPTNRAYLRGYGLYEEALDNDPHLLGVVKQRQGAVLSAEDSLLIPRGYEEVEQARRIHGFTGAVIEDLKHWGDTRGELWFANFYGVTYLAPDWQERDVYYLLDGREETLREAIVPFELLSRRRGRFGFDRDLKLRLYDNFSSDGDEVPDKAILYHAPRKRYENPYGVPLARVLFRYHWMKKHSAKWKIVDLEKFGSPFVLLTYEDNPSDEEKDNYESILKNVAMGCGLLLPKKLAGQVTNIAHSTSGASPHQPWAEFCNAEMSKAVLGQTLTTEQGDTGARAMAGVHMDVRADIIQADADNLCEAVQQLIDWIVEVNFGPEYLRLAPRYRIETRQVDVAAELDNAKKAQDIGLTLSESQLRERTGYEAPEEGDELTPPRNPSPFGMVPGGEQNAPNREQSPPSGEQKDEEGTAGAAARATSLLLFASTTEAVHNALRLNASLSYQRPAGFTASENKRARLTGALADKLPTEEARKLFTDGVQAQAAILSELPGMVRDWVLAQYSAKGASPDTPLDEAHSELDPRNLDWAELDAPAEMRGAFVDQLNDDHTIAQLLAREQVLLKADAEGLEARFKGGRGKPRPYKAGADVPDPENNPYVEVLWGEDRIVPHRVLSVHNRRVRQSVSWDTFYQLDALGRSASYTAWDLLISDVRHMGGAQQDALRWGYTVQQYADYLYDRLQARYVIQGETLHAWHVETIYSTNLATAYNQAQADELYELRDTFEYTQFVNPDPQHPACVERAGNVYPTDSEFLYYNTPPLHFGCGSSLIALTAAMVERQGLNVETAMPTTSPEIYEGPRDPQTGERVGSPQPFGAWAPIEERYQHLEQELERVGAGNA